MELNNLDYRLLARYLAGKCSSEDRKKVKQWIDGNPENAEVLNQFKQIWEVSGSSSKSREFNTGSEWERLNERFKKEPAPSPSTSKTRSSDRVFQSSSIHSATQIFIRVAAIILIAGFAGLFAYSHWYEPVSGEKEAVLREISTNKGQRANLTLADGTKVMLNAASRIKLPKEFDSEVRAVHLKGEAYFEVAKNKEKPFLIYVNQSVIRVLGTSFSVRSYPEDKQVQVVVREGRVSLGKKDAEKADKAILKGGELGAFNIETHDIRTRSVEDLSLYLSWREGYLKFQNADMSTVAKSLERRYDVQVSFADKAIKELSLTAFLKSRSIQNVLEVIATSLEIEYQLEEDRVTFIKK